MSGPNSNEVSPATLEIDIPPFAMAPSPENLSSKVVDALEREKFEHKKSIDRWGFYLLIGAIVLYFAMYVMEKQTGNAEMSQFTSTISETMKFLISTLIGYLFASRT